MSKPVPPEKRLEWERKFRQQRESGLSIERWCRQNQLLSPTFYYWRDRLFPKSELTRASFVELPSHSSSTGISIEYRGVKICLDKSFDPTTLKNCLSALREIPC